MVRVILSGVFQRLLKTVIDKNLLKKQVDINDIKENSDSVSLFRNIFFYSKRYLFKKYEKFKMFVCSKSNWSWF